MFDIVIEFIDKNTFDIIVCGVGIIVATFFFRLTYSNWYLRKMHIRLNAIDNKNLLKEKRLDYYEEWISEWRCDYALYCENDFWKKEKLRFEPRNGRVYFKNSDNPEGYNYEGSGSFYGENYFSGEWQSLKSASASKGLASFVISGQGDYLYGFYIGKNNDGIEEIGPWVIAKDQNTLEKAKQAIKDSHYSFKSDSPIRDNLRKKFHIYHFTRMGDNEIWRHNIVDFSKIKNHEVLIGLITTTNKDNETCFYSVKAGLSGSHFVWIIKNTESNEEPSIWIFPHMYRMIEKVNYGTAVGENWNKDAYFGKIIISDAPIGEMITVGNIDQDNCDLLNRMWNENFSKENELPSDLNFRKRRKS